MANDARQLADELRETPPVLDDLARARMEKAILAAPRTVVVERPRPSRRPFVAGVGAGLAVAAAALVTWWAMVPGREASAPTAGFETFVGDQSIRSGSFAEGEVVTTDAEQHVRAHFAERRVEVAIAPRSRARFVRLDGPELAVALDRGAVRVEFHPERRGERALAIETPLARVEVVGTVFEVEVDSDHTHVRVREGIVRVVPREGAERFVHAGEAMDVRPLRGPEHAEVGPIERASVERTGEVPGWELGTDVDPELGVVPFGEPFAELGADEPLGPSSRTSATSARASEALEGTALEATPLEAAALEAAATEATAMEATSEAEATTEADVAAEPTGRARRPLAEDLRFELAMRFVDRGSFDEARHVLHAIVRTSGSRAHRARAWMDIALTHSREGDVRQASEAYRRAAQVGRGTDAGANALFALGQMRLQLGEDELARAAFRDYLDAAPAGPLADRARRTLCQRLGEWRECGE